MSVIALRSLFFAFAVSTLAPLALADKAVSPDEALAKYVAAPDDSYQWKVRSEGTLGRGKYYELILTSQTWKDIPWKHQVFLFKPASCKKDAKHALLYITGGGWRKELEEPRTPEEKLPKDADAFALMAEAAQSPLVILQHVPQQPIFNGLKEDGAISYTFAQYIKTGDPTWPLLLPMTKSAVRGMDCATEACKEKWDLQLEGFTVTGGSKRGWTTYLTGAIDKRAVAIAPIVINMLNMREHTKLQRESFGDLSDEIQEYKALGLDRAVETDPGAKLMKIVDPFSYREKLTQPKLLILGTNDRYWPVDSTKLYYSKLIGEKNLLFVPNNGHGVKDIARIAGGLTALHVQAQGGPSLPKVKYELAMQPQEVGKRPAGAPAIRSSFQLKAEYDRAPKEVRLWQASAETRDFRTAEWTATPVKLDGNAAAETIDQDEKRFKAVFLEGEWEEGENATPLMLSTELYVIAP